MRIYLRKAKANCVKAKPNDGNRKMGGTGKVKGHKSSSISSSSSFLNENGQEGYFFLL